MNDNHSDKGIRVFHFFFMIFSGVLILSGFLLAGTMIYRALDNNAQEAAQDIAVIARDENMQGEGGKPMPQMFTVPDTLGAPGGGMAEPVEAEGGVTDMDAVPDEKKDDLTLPLFDDTADGGGEVKPLEEPEE